jgi:hypothetical protein
VINWIAVYCNEYLFCEGHSFDYKEWVLFGMELSKENINFKDITRVYISEKFQAGNSLWDFPKYYKDLSKDVKDYIDKGGAC